MDVIERRRPTLVDVPNLWKHDGGFRDIYVLRTSLEDWRRFAALVVSYSFEYDGEQGALPDVESVLRDDLSHRLLVRVGGVELSCNFFDVSEIEIDIVPHQVGSESDHDGVLEFVERLGYALGKPVILTPENETHTPIVSFDPLNDTWRWKADWSPL